MLVHGELRDAEAVSNLVVGEPAREGLKDHHFVRRQTVGLRGNRGAPLIAPCLLELLSW
jgi:hypothetical protein